MSAEVTNPLHEGLPVTRFDVSRLSDSVLTFPLSERQRFTYFVT